MEKSINPKILGYVQGKAVYEVGGGTPTDEDYAKLKAEQVPALMGTITETLKKALGEHETKLQATFQKYEDDLKNHGAVSEATKADLKKMAEDYTGMRNDVDKILQSQTKFLDDKPKRKTPGGEFVGSDEFKKAALAGGDVRISKKFDSPVFLKNTILGEGGSPQDPESVIVQRHEVPGIVPGAFRMLSLLDVLPMGITASNLVHYTRELTFTNSAAETAEGVTKPESSLTFEDASAPVRTIAHWLKVSKQVMDDAPALQSYIDQRLRYGVRLRFEQQLLAGTGVSPLLSGLIGDTNNHTALAAVSGEINFDAANRAKYAVVSADYMPDAYLINPADWGNMERKKDGAGRYFGDQGVINYLAGGLIPTLWGLPVILSNSVPAGQFVAISLASMMAWLRQEATVTIHDQDTDNVQKNLLTIRGEMRAAFTVFRPAANVVGSWPE